jgi:hypothetical protein
MFHLITALLMWVAVIAAVLLIFVTALAIVASVAPVVAAMVIVFVLFACVFLGIAKASARKLPR